MQFSTLLICSTQMFSSCLKYKCKSSHWLSKFFKIEFIFLTFSAAQVSSWKVISLEKLLGNYPNSLYLCHSCTSIKIKLFFFFQRIWKKKLSNVPFVYFVFSLLTQSHLLHRICNKIHFSYIFSKCPPIYCQSGVNGPQY